MSRTVRTDLISVSIENKFEILRPPDQMDEGWEELLENFETDFESDIPHTYAETRLLAETFELNVDDMIDVVMGYQEYIETSVDPPVYRKYRLEQGSYPAKGDILEEHWNVYLDGWMKAPSQGDGILTPENIRKDGTGHPFPLMSSDIGKRYPATPIPDGVGYHDRVTSAEVARKGKRKRNRVPHYAYALVEPETRITRVIRSERDVPNPSGSQVRSGIISGDLKLVRISRKVGSGYTSVKHYVMRTAPSAENDYIVIPGDIIVERNTFNGKELLSPPIKEDE